MIFNMGINTIKSVNQFTNNLSDYYFNLLKSWISINKYTKIPSNFRIIRQELIWGNQHIKFKNKSLIYLNWINDGIIFINDIIDHEGKLSENVILKKLSLKTNWISEFTKLKKSIPKNWLNELESEKICSNLHFIILKKINSKYSDGYYYISYFHVNSYCINGK